jgi:hypothetical protein
MITRRQFISLSAATAALSLTSSFRGQSAPATPAAPSSAKKKKGLGRSAKSAGWAKNLTDLRCNWFYSWNSAVPDGVPPGIEFIPMIYRYGGNAKAAAAVAAAAQAARKAGTTDLLGFNEPEKKEQGNMTLDEALDAWPVLMETGLRLGSPGCVHPDKEWMIAFMDGVKKRGLRVDFVCVHSYGGPNADALVNRLEKVHQMFGCPLWITEFGVGDWKAKSPEQNQHKPETVLRFMEQVLPRLEKLDFLERYAWFPSKPTSAPLGSSALYDDNGVLTRLGECYRDA